MVGAASAIDVNKAGEPFGFRGADRAAKQMRLQLLVIGFGELPFQIVEKPTEWNGLSASLFHASALSDSRSTHSLRRAMAR